MLNDINKNEYLNNKLVLKGGTALNLFYFEIPRLSIDIDFNAIGIGDKSNLIAVRPKIEAEIENVIKKKDYRIRRKKMITP
ncbi:MAG: nucleotidyl transferase AbiEii/AbiGii toxin family protein [Kosmotogaceae bacterium]